MADDIAPAPAPAPAPPTSPEALLALLARLGIATTTHRHPPLFTVEQSKALRGSLPGAHTKNLFLKDREGQFWLATMLEHRRVPMGPFARALGAPRFSFGSAEDLFAHLGVTPGAVTPFGLVNDRAHRVRFIADQRMMAGFELLNFHPLTNEATTAITPAGFARFLAETGHAPRLFDFEALEASLPPGPAGGP
ncbi:MAG: prolyl-tRNA synthetase associated domain-containing protein [Alphaproteobacteria bacterium]|nr:prolyl-tRNA synthetase associated domain-containing protein [Alphaproteobacteria bacterium]